MKISSTSSVQLTDMIMTNHRYQNLYYFCARLTVLSLLIQCPIFVIAQPTQSTFASHSHAITTTTTTISTILYNDGNVYDGEHENSMNDGDIYDDQGESNENSPPTIISQTKSHNNLTTSSHDETSMNEYDEISSYQDDDDDREDQIYGNSISVNRAESKNTINDDSNKKTSSVTESTSRIAFISSDLWRDLFSKPAILVGIVGGVVIGMLSAILLIMFIIYRMRKKDEGSYALEEGPRKSPSHAYTRVSSREFFA